MTANVQPTWRITEIISQNVDIPETISKNLVDLFEADNTIPFIARYRKHLTNNMEVDKIRMVKNELDSLKSVITKMNSSFVAIEKQGKMTRELKASLEYSHTMEQIEHVYAPFKPGSKRTLAARARENGLETLAMDVTRNPYNATEEKFKSFIRDSDSVDTVDDALLGCQHIIADVVSKDKDIMEKVWQGIARFPSRIDTQRTPPPKVKAKAGEKKPTTKNDESYKFERYFDFTSNTKTIQPHQVLAINRGEKQKVLVVKITINDRIHQIYKQTCERSLIKNNMFKFQRDLVERSIDDAYTRLIQPMLCRHIRSELQKKAHQASVDVFAANLKRLLLTPPVRGKIVLGLDPGFTHGCKLAVVSETGKILHTDIVYLHGQNFKLKNNEQHKLVGIITQYQSASIAIGNGTACRETETVVSQLIKSHAFGPLNVMYCIVNENGASIYSVSDQAQKEMPDLDPSYRGAVSIARRLQDPLAELVKIEPKHIGIGMYQHDVNESLLQSSLNEIVEECVSFVGVDVNSCSECLLKHVSGLTASRAKAILEWRDKNGQFHNREDLRLVKGIGDKTYQQCIGFMRISIVSDNQSVKLDGIDPKSELDDTKLKKAGQKRKAVSSKTTAKKAKVKGVVDPLDRTSIHPESYDTARKFMKQSAVDSVDIGESATIIKVKNFMLSSTLENVAQIFSVDIHSMKLIVDGLSQPLEHDIRENFEKPLFKNSVMSLSDAKVGAVVTGRVVNVTHFGAFVDIGVGQDSLLHNSKMRPCNMNGKKSLELGDRVEVRICNVDLGKKRVGVELIKLC